MSWSYGIDGYKDNEMISVGWLVVFTTLVDFDFWWGT